MQTDDRHAVRRFFMSDPSWRCLKRHAPYSKGLPSREPQASNLKPSEPGCALSPAGAITSPVSNNAATSPPPYSL